jgi:hypothetical protein
MEIYAAFRQEDYDLLTDSSTLFWGRGDIRRAGRVVSCRIESDRKVTQQGECRRRGNTRAPEGALRPGDFETFRGRLRVRPRQLRKHDRGRGGRFVVGPSHPQGAESREGTPERDLTRWSCGRVHN